MLSMEKINKKLKDKNIDEYYALEDSKDQNAKIKFIHKPCQTEFLATVKYVLSGDKKCPNCKKYKKWDSNRLLEFMSSNIPDYSLISPINSEHIRSHDKITLLHNICDNTYISELSNFVNGGYRCPFCSKNNLRKDYKNTFKELIESNNPEYKVIGNYESHNKKIKFLHEKCGHYFEMRPENFLQGQRCPYCRRNRPYTIDTIKQKIKDVSNDEYELLSNEYNSMKIKYTLRHKICNKSFDTNLNDFINGGHRCPFCKTFSKGELGIRNYLEKNNINFTEQYTFPDLKSKNNRLLKFDFAILDENNSVKELIEFDGSHHFHDYGRPKKFADIKDRDERKNKYCKDNNIKLTRIAHWKNINKTLDKILFQNNSSTTSPDECKGVEPSGSKCTTESI